MYSTAPATSFIHKTSHKGDLKSPRRSKWASMHIKIAWQIYFKEQQREIQLKSKSLLYEFDTKASPIQCNLDTACSESVNTNSPYLHSQALHRQSSQDKLHPYQFCNGIGKYEQHKKLVCDFETCHNYIWKPREKKRHYEFYPTFYPSFCREKRQTQAVQDDFWSHTTSDKKAVFYSNSGNWNKNLQLIYSPSANPIYQHQEPSMLTCVKLEGTNRSPFYPPVLLTQDFKHKTFNQVTGQNCNAQRLCMPPASLWTYDNCLFGAPDL